MAAVNENFIHSLRRGSVSHLRNPVARKYLVAGLAEERAERVGLADADLQREHPAGLQSAAAPS